MTALNPNPYLPMDAPLLRQRIEEADPQQIGTAQLEELIERMETIARIIQHEIDHLHGLRFPDRMLYRRKLHWVAPEERDRYFKEQESWPHSCSKEEWQALVGIEKS